MKVSELDVPPERAEEFKWFLACVCGEAWGSKESAWRAVAHVIMNRINHADFDKLRDAEAVVKAAHQFSCYRDEHGESSSNFKKGLQYCDESRNAGLPTSEREQIDAIKKAVLPVFLRRAGEGARATFFFSPDAQRKLHPNNPFPAFAKPGINIEVTEQVLGLAHGQDFRFFRRPVDMPRDQVVAR